MQKTLADIIEGEMPLEDRELTFKITGADDRQVGGDHYKQMEIQPWEVMESLLSENEFIGFLKGNVIKYAMRAGKKEGSDDYEKMRHYMEKLDEFKRRGLPF